MSDEIQFDETRRTPVCPHCEAELNRIDYRRQKLTFGFTGFTWVVLLSCPACRRVLGTQSWG